MAEFSSFSLLLLVKVASLIPGVDASVLLSGGVQTCVSDSQLAFHGFIPVVSLPNQQTEASEEKPCEGLRKRPDVGVFPRCSDNETPA